MGSLLQNFQSSKGRAALPISRTNPSHSPKLEAPCSASAVAGGMRRRLSSLSVHVIQPSTSAATSWALRRSKSVSAMGETAGTSLRNWWDWSWGWILSRKPTFAQDLEMNEQEKSLLGSHNRGSLKHVFYKVRSELRKLVGGDKVGLPQTVRYDSYSYSQNFDNGSSCTRTR